MGRNEDLIKELEMKLANCKAQNLKLIHEHERVMNLKLKEYKQKVNKAIIEFNSTKGVWLDPNIQREAFGKLLKDLKIEY